MISIQNNIYFITPLFLACSSLASETLWFETKVSGFEPKIELIEHRPGDFRVKSTQRGILESSDSLHGPWKTASTNSRTLHKVELSDSQKFFRVQGTTKPPERAIWLHLPDNLDQASYPLIVNLHGFGDNPESQDARIPLSTFVDEKEFIYCLPKGARDPNFGDPNGLGWDANSHCCKGTPGRVDDVAYILSVVAWIKERYPIDEDRVYALGFSNGGNMTHRLLCDASHVFSAGVAIAGVGDVDLSICKPSFPISFLQIIGTLDENNPFYGGAFVPISNRSIPGVLDNLHHLMGEIGIPGELQFTGNHLDIDSGLEGSETEVVAPNGNVAIPNTMTVELWKVIKGRHFLKMSDSEAPVRILEWLLNHPRVSTP